MSFVKFLLVGILSALLFLGIIHWWVWNDTPIQPPTTPWYRLHAVDDTSVKLARNTEGKVTFWQYEDPLAGLLFLPPAHFAWVTSNAGEKKVLNFFNRLVKCPPDSLMLDVGMNDGIYSLLAAARGCRVVSFELQSQCIALARSAQVG